MVIRGQPWWLEISHSFRTPHFLDGWSTDGWWIPQKNGAHLVVHRWLMWIRLMISQNVDYNP